MIDETWIERGLFLIQQKVHHGMSAEELKLVLMRLGLENPRDYNAVGFSNLYGDPASSTAKSGHATVSSDVAESLLIEPSRHILPEEVAFIEADIEKAKQESGRKCGECSTCCLLFSVPEVDNQRGKWCPHCRPGNGGCSIYNQRPPICRTYSCGWLINKLVPEYWAPLESKLVVDVRTGPPNKRLCIHVHPDYPNRWREEPYYSDVQKWALNGLNGTIGGNPEYFETVIVYREVASHLVLPQSIVPLLTPPEDMPATLRELDEREEREKANAREYTARTA